MVASSFKFGPGITITSGVTLYPSGGGGPAPGDITLTYNEFAFGGGGPVTANFEDSTATVTGTGFITTNPNKTGVLMSGLTTPNFAFVSTNLPDSGPGGSGEIWTAHWSSGSTYSTTPVAIYYSSSSFAGTPSIIYWILDPADNTYHTGIAGTFNFPMTLTAGTTTTTFTN
jgi:hypothetical protein